MLTGFATGLATGLAVGHLNSAHTGSWWDVLGLLAGIVVVIGALCFFGWISNITGVGELPSEREARLRKKKEKKCKSPE